MTKKTDMLIPEYIESFSCIGSSCEDTCCAGWNVDIDKSTYEMYQSLPGGRMKDIIQKVAKVTQKSENEYASIELDEMKKCPLLDGGWCSVHKNLGESYLSSTCSNYPKSFSIIDEIVEKSANVSCPEIARLALLNPNGIGFKQIKEELSGKVKYKRILQTPNEKDESKYLWELRLFSIEVLQNRMYSIDERLIVLGVFFQKLQGYLDNHQTDMIPNLANHFRNEMANGHLKKLVENIQVSYDIQMQLLRDIVQIRMKNEGVSTRFKECYESALRGIGYEEAISNEELSKNYLQAINNYYKPYIEQKEYILENYLVNYIFKNVFPCSGKLTVYEEFSFLTLHYSIIKLMLIGMTADHKELFDDGMIVKLIQSFSRSVEHDALFVYHIYNILKNKGFHTLPYMTILIKS